MKKRLNYPQGIVVGILSTFLSLFNPKPIFALVLEPSPATKLWSVALFGTIVVVSILFIITITLLVLLFINRKDKKIKLKIYEKLKITAILLVIFIVFSILFGFFLINILKALLGSDHPFFEQTILSCSSETCPFPF